MVALAEAESGHSSILKVSDLTPCGKKRRLEILILDIASVFKKVLRVI
tara:strand:- start:189 stop:332 length:144 start_codon:yes stop_codon:yes gene_type:complete